MTAYVDSLIEEYGLFDVRVSTTAAPLSKSELEAVREETTKRLHESELGTWSIYTPSRTGQIHVEVGTDRSDGPQLAGQLIDSVATADARRTDVFAPVVATTVENTSFAGGGEFMTMRTAAVGGSPFNCTSGFAVRDNTGPAIVTAGHCRDYVVRLTDSSGAGNEGNQVITLANALNDGYVNGGRDRQFHRLTGGAVADPAIRISPNGTRRAITGVRTPLATDVVCQFGQNTNSQQCGQVLQLGMTSTFEGVSLTGMIRTAARTAAGDSGGPAYMGADAVGLVSRRTGPCLVALEPNGACPVNGEAVLQPIGTALAGTGFTLLGAGDTGRFVALQNPGRIHDSRPSNPIAAGGVRRVPVRGLGGVPNHENVSAVVLNVTTINPTGAGYLQVYPGGMQRPGLASSGNYPSGSITAHHITVPLIGTNHPLLGHGAVDIWSQRATHVTVDVLGYYRHDANTQRVNLLETPQRAIDTRTPPQVSIGAGQTRNVTLPVAVPSGAHAVLVNVTAINPTQQTHLTAHSPAVARPAISHLNATPGLVTANLVTTRVRSISTGSGNRAQMALYNHAGNTNVIVDVLGWYTSTGQLVVSMRPTRVHDTRSGTAIGAGQVRIIPVRGSVAAQATIPDNATGVMMRVTAMQSTANGFVTVSRNGTSTTSTLNTRTGVVVSNAVVVPMSNNVIRVYNSAGTTHVTVDVEGYIYPG